MLSNLHALFTLHIYCAKPCKLYIPYSRCVTYIRYMLYVNNVFYIYYTCSILNIRYRRHIVYLWFICCLYHLHCIYNIYIYTIYTMQWDMRANCNSHGPSRIIVLVILDRGGDMHVERIYIYIYIHIYRLTDNVERTHGKHIIIIIIIS